MIKELVHKAQFMGSIPFGSDLLDGLSDLCLQKNITLGKVEAIGAVQKACFGFYNQNSCKYEYLEKSEELEILHCGGNISLNEGKPMIHAHITLANDRGIAFGGHLAKGTIVFAAEFVIQSFAGTELIRGYDQATGLRLWKQK